MDEVATRNELASLRERRGLPLDVAGETHRPELDAVLRALEGLDPELDTQLEITDRDLGDIKRIVQRLQTSRAMRVET